MRERLCASAETLIFMLLSLAAIDCTMRSRLFRLLLLSLSLSLLSTVPRAGGYLLSLFRLIGLIIYLADLRLD